MKATSISVLALALFGACAPAFAQSTAAEQKAYDEARGMQWWNACIAWGKETRKDTDSLPARMLRKYLVDNQMLNKVDEAHVNDKSLAIGMTECGMIASKGVPEASNNTTTASGRATQHVYRDRRLYVYTEHVPGVWMNIIRAIQN